MQDRKTIEKAMLCCRFDMNCIGEECPYHNLSNPCEKAIIEDALVLIHELDKENTKIKRKVKQFGKFLMNGE